MQTHVDYETETTLAVFWSPRSAAEAAEQLRDSDIGVNLLRLPPGRYQLADTSLGDEVGGILHGAGIGAAVGALAGMLLAMTIAGWGLPVFVGLAAAGAMLGAVVGGLVGATTRARFDDDVTGSLNVSKRRAAVVVIAHTNLLDGGTGRAYAILRHTGAAAFLDPTTVTVEDDERLAHAGAAEIAAANAAARAHGLQPSAV